jgi:hypothetical protein
VKRHEEGPPLANTRVAEVDALPDGQRQLQDNEHSQDRREGDGDQPLVSVERQKRCHAAAQARRIPLCSQPLSRQQLREIHAMDTGSDAVANKLPYTQPGAETVRIMAG